MLAFDIFAARKNLKAQFTIVSLIGILMILALLVAVYPMLSQYINAAASQAEASGDHLTAQTIRLIPFFIVVSIILTTVFIALPKTE